MLAIQIRRVGGPEVLEPAQVQVPVPGAGQIRVRHTAIGLNFIDTYQRSGLYPVPLPTTLGVEAAGIVDAVDPAVTRFVPGQRVAYSGSPGAYAEYNVLPADRAVHLPDAISDTQAAGAMLKGLTAEFLLRRLWPLTSGDSVLVHAAAGGVGSILCQWGCALGLHVIGAVGASEKVAAALTSGCAAVLRSDQGPMAPRIRELTQGLGARVVFDSVGRDSFDDSLAAVRSRGLLVSFGNASGPAPAVEPSRLMRAGSIFLTRPSLFDYIATPDELDQAAAALFDVVARGAVKVAIGQTFALADARSAHEALEGRRTIGSTLLIP